MKSRSNRDQYHITKDHLQLFVNEDIPVPCGLEKMTGYCFSLNFFDIILLIGFLLAPSLIFHKREDRDHKYYSIYIFKKMTNPILFLALYFPLFERLASKLYLNEQLRLPLKRDDFLIFSKYLFHYSAELP